MARYYPDMTDPTPTPDRLAPPEAVLSTPTPFIVEKIATMEYKTFHYNVVIFTRSEQFPTPAIDPDWVHEDIQRIAERYAQVGVKMIAESLEIRHPPDGVFDENGSITALQKLPPNYELTENMRTLIDSLEPTLGSDSFCLIFVPELIGLVPTPTVTPPPYPTPSPTTPTPTPTGQQIICFGVGLHEWLVCEADINRINNAIVNGMAVYQYDKYFVSSHEIGHCLINYGHFSTGPQGLQRVNIMTQYSTSGKLNPFDPTPVHHVFSTKRFSDKKFTKYYPAPTPNVTQTPKSQEEWIHEHKLVY